MVATLLLVTKITTQIIHYTIHNMEHKTAPLDLFSLAPEQDGNYESISNTDQLIEVSFHLKPQQTEDDSQDRDMSLLSEHPSNRKYLTRTALKKLYSADKAIVSDFVKWIKDFDIKVIESSATDRLVTIETEVDKLTQLLSCDFEALAALNTEESHLIAYGEISLPEHILDNLSSISGIHAGVKKARRDNHKNIAEAEDVKPSAAPAPQKFLGYTPQQIETAYNFPNGDGSGQTIGLVELGGTYKQSDLDTFFGKFGIEPPKITVIGTPPGTSAMDDFEVTLDIELAASLAPKAKFVIYYGKSLIDAIKSAIADTKNKPTILSISWAGSEFNYSQNELMELNQLLYQASTLGITVVAASGDQGAFNLKSYLNVNVPASSPYTLGCGGTSLYTSSEAVWNELAIKQGATGGGFSAKFSRPNYQTQGVDEYNAHSATPGPSNNVRAVPDISANADASTGYQIVLNGATFPGGGTSAATPVWAALIARINQNLGYNLGFTNDLFYQMYATGALRPVSKDKTGTALGNNGHYLGLPGWNPCTGLGSPDGKKILEIIKSTEKAK